MIRLATFIALSALTVPAMAQLKPWPDTAPALKREVTVSNEIVRIGDLVENAGAVADVAIFRAPDLGQTGAVSVKQVVEAVRPHQLLDLDTRGLDEVVVIRASRSITAKDIEARIVRALAGQYGLGDGKNLIVTFDNPVRTIYVEPSANADLAVARMGFDPRNGRFDMSFELPGSMAARKLPRFTGSIVETFEAAVPARVLAQGETLKASDLTIERRPKSEFTPTTITDPAQAAGFALRRALRPSQVIRQADLMKPELVQRNETVTISYEVPGIRLSIRGQAQESGTLGDLINVLNVQSKRTIQATVVGPGQVSVASISPRFAAVTAPSTPQRQRPE
jgi:flagella basal body P-ring formation protein FlgA